MGWNNNSITSSVLVQTNGSSASQFLILGVVLAVVWALLTSMFVYYFYNFKKIPAEDKIYGPKMLWSTLVVGFIILVCWVLELAFYEQGQNVFDGNLDRGINVEIALAVIGFVSLLAVIIMMWFFLPYYGIAFDDKRILFMGESISYESITKIVIDEKTRATFVNYRQGKRTYKRLKFPAISGFGQFVQANASATGKDLSEEDENAYFKSLMTTDKASEKKNNK